MMKAALIFLLAAVFGVSTGLWFDSPGAIDFGRITVFFAVIFACIGMVTSIASDPSIKHLLYRR